ncbi:UspA domain protein (plasmid) [Haloterrigena turkmenica DSM 5511]|uniref:UspA domain protein n=1 Tax=Haloterrigena turkmenica (strain ATCC 51198 / DSM 5511 / JCM 9101 / NCIMB 13204 / VKM B-1734 / 4k) TaxID=543526 RepID=D2S1G8_HALTV|nr:universal stress protein [Haloterrigena turkmenica]ADB63215.1 UspA domain protein [Haloterrigena turkmenica DSM 5511]
MSNDRGSTESFGLETVVLAVGGRDENRAEKLVDVALQITSPGHSEVVVVHTFDSDSYTETVQSISSTADEYIEPDELAAQMDVVQGITSQLTENDIDCDVRATTGRKGQGIVDIAADLDADRVIVGGQQRSPTGKAIFGSMVQKVLLNAPCPVTFVRDQDN